MLQATFSRFRPHDPTEELSQYTTTTVDINGCTINYAKTGTGPAMVLIHGLANNWFGWGPLIPLLKKHFTLYLIDLPGFGDSGDLKEYSIEIASEYVIDFVDQIDEDEVYLTGVSMGSLVAAHAGAAMNGKLKGLILLGAIVPGKRTTFLTNLLQMELELANSFEFTQYLQKKIVETRAMGYIAAKYANMHKFNRFLVDMYGHIGRAKMRKETLVQMGISLAKYDVIPLLSSYKVPVLLIYGHEDKVTNPENAQSEIVPNNELVQHVTIPDAGHVVPMEKPQEVADEIRRFVGR